MIESFSFKVKQKNLQYPGVDKINICPIKTLSSIAHIGKNLPHPDIFII